MPKYFALRPHQGDKWYDVGAPRELPAKDAVRLVSNGVLGTEPPAKARAKKAAPAKKAK